MIKFATEFLFENFRIGDDLLAGREYFFDHFTAPDAHFFWCCRRATQLEVDISGFPNVVAHFKRMQERPSVNRRTPSIDAPRKFPASNDIGSGNEKILGTS